MKTQTFFLAVALAVAGSTPGTHAQTTFLPQSETDAIVLKFQVAYADTFDRRDAKGMAALLTEDSTLQNEWGDVVQGRTNIEATLQPEYRARADVFHTGAGTSERPMAAGCDSNRSAFCDAETSQPAEVNCLLKQPVRWSERSHSPFVAGSFTLW